jgi:hypothetical protein
MEGKNSYGYEFCSFDRFGDDFCELILSYLTMSDKIVLECVSKQLQRLIFNKQKKLSITIHYNRLSYPNDSIVNKGKDRKYVDE